MDFSIFANTFFYLKKSISERFLLEFIFAIFVRVSPRPRGFCLMYVNYTPCTHCHILGYMNDMEENLMAHLILSNRDYVNIYACALTNYAMTIKLCHLQRANYHFLEWIILKRCIQIEKLEDSAGYLSFAIPVQTQCHDR